MKIMLHTNTLNYRGTTVAISDYAKYLQEFLGHEPIITYCKTNGQEKDMGNEPAVIESLEKKFQVVGYRAGDLESKVEDLGVDLAYFIDSGQKKILPTNCKTAVHAVFQFYDPHGDRYAYISKWLSHCMTNGESPYVPHIVSLPQPTFVFRKHLGIRDDQTVVGRIGGFFTFDIPFVKETITKMVKDTDQFVFLFVGTEPFIDHPQVKFISEIHDPQKKSNFINSCDVMLHARVRGESFGLSICEFLFFNKPVLAWTGGHDKHHLDLLKDGNVLYNDSVELTQQLHNVKNLGKQEDWSQRVKEFAPRPVIEQFNNVFLV